MPESRNPSGAHDLQPAAWYQDHPHARMSFTRLSVYRRCPAWYRHQYLEWHRTWDLPVMTAGHAVQATLERVFDASPRDGASLEDLAKRCRERAAAVFEEEWTKAARAFEASLNALGTFSIPKERYAAYVEAGLRWHLEEVRARLERRHPRSGAALDLPPLATPAEAWAAVRPWHATKKDEDDLALDTIPGGWFQGQYDLVYNWTGARRIVDLKASKGTSLFGTEISGQLLSYAWMERCAGKPPPEGLEGWFLGQGEPRVFPLPSEEDQDAFAEEVIRLIKRSKSEEGYGAWRAADFPAAPAVVPGFAADPGEPSPWCSVCPAAHVCTKSRKTAPDPGQGLRFDQAKTPSRAAIEGLVLGISTARAKNGRPKRRVTLANATGARTYGWDADVVERLAKDGLRAGRVVRVTELRPWQPPGGDEPLWFTTDQTRVTTLAETWPGLPADPEAQAE